MWVTGAGKGIGRELAKIFAENSWTVAVSARTENDLISLQNEFANKQINKYPLDVSDLEATVRTLSLIHI